MSFGPIAVGDVDGDGRSDIVLGTSAFDGGWDWRGPTGFTVLSLLADGGFSPFEPIVVFSNGAAVIDLAVQDINGDGYPDIVLVDYYAGIGFIHGLSDGGLSTPEILPFLPALLVNDAPNQFAVGDLDGDGLPDIVVSTQRRSLGVALQGPSGQFAWAGGPSIEPDTDLVPLVVDGQIALVGGYGIWLEHWDPDAGLVTVATYATGQTGYAAGAADLNGDGRTDLVIGDGPRILFNHGGAYGLPSPPLGDSMNWYAGQFAMADFDGDGRPDIAVPFVSSTDAGLAVFLNGCGADGGSP
jgi:hypothetical protein